MDHQMLSKVISYALRHAPHEYELELDEYGWVHIDQLLYSLREQEMWNLIERKDLHQMIALSDKKRHEIQGDKIRALYGHSVPQKIMKEEKEPPKTLFHGTPKQSASLIMLHGLLPKGRQYVHLSEEVETALQVGKRRDEQPVILMIDAKRAWDEGVKFYHGNERVWLADQIDKQYISIYES